MNRILLIIAVFFVFLIGTIHLAKSQCSSCTPNQALLSPASNYPDGALAPDPAPAITQGVPYDTSITYVMPATYDAGAPIGVVNVDQVIVSNIAGLPSGISWSCNVANCTYFPQQNQYGCITFCGTTFATPGIYPITVTVIGTALGQSQPTYFDTQVEVLSSSGGNSGYTFSPTQGCDSVDVIFQALIDGSPNPTTYNWTFANGNISTDAIPLVQTFNNIGYNITTLETTIWDYVLTDVTASTTDDSWCDLDDGFVFVCLGDPDIEFDLYASSGPALYSGAYVSNSVTASWSNINQILDPNNNPFSLAFADNDNIGVDDLGSISFNVTAPGTFSATSSHASISYTIILQPQSIITNVDTIVIYESPATPTITYAIDSICAGDSVLFTASSSAGLSYLWSADGTALVTQTSNSIYVNDISSYNVMVSDSITTCSSFSSDYGITVLDYPPLPNISFDAVNSLLEVTNSSNFAIQWYLDGVAVLGANGTSYNDLSVSGPFTVELSNALGCSMISFPYTVCLPGNVLILPTDTICCGDTINLFAEGFTLNPTSDIVWAITTEASGPVTNQAEATIAQDNNQLLLNLGDSVKFTRNCPAYEDSIFLGNYYITPFTAQDPNVTLFTWDTLEGCSPNGQICPSLIGQDSTWLIYPMVFTFPDGSQMNVNDELAFGLPLSQPLLDIVGGNLCLDLTTIFSGNPNGQWEVSITNTGAVDIDFDVPDFLVYNYADSCNLITQDEVYTIPGFSLTAASGETISSVFDIPPIPSGFPTVETNCEAFGTPYLITYADCYPYLTNTLDVIGVPVNPFYDAQNNYSYGYIDVSIAGGTAPYTISWADGPTSEDRFNLQPGSYTILVTDASGFTVSESWTLTGPYLGISQLDIIGFELSQNTPNPFSSVSNIIFRSQSAKKLTFTIKSIDGRLVYSEIINAQPGANKILVDGTNLSSGLYLYTLNDNINSNTKQFVVSK